jgi:hypothetical protein
LVAQGSKVLDAVRLIGVSQLTYDPHPNRYSFISRVRFGYGPWRTGLQTRSA